MYGRILAACAATALASAGAAAQTILLENATLIDGSGSPPQPNITIVIERGRIVDIRPTPQGTTVRATSADTTIIDLTGKFVVPGIINAHGHVGPPPRDPKGSIYVAETDWGRRIQKFKIASEP